ncbi:MAG: DNA mismatch repair endonuclease MutL [Anaerovoracaceae bacterium]
MIRVLEKNLTDKIAAGEVVERPLSIVKELVENSIDSGADTIVIEIKRGGKEYIRVSDNGSGIVFDEIKTAFLRHATSKIEALEDLFKIDSLGFRGEALSSIASVSKVEIVTRTKEAETGGRALLHGGEVIDFARTGSPIGTTIVVEDLFYNTPARLKFLKSDNVETTPVVELVSKLALGNPGIRFRLINNSKTLLSTNGSGDIKQIISMVYGKEVGDNLVSIYKRENTMEVKGYTSTLNLSRPGRRLQVFYVNERLVESDFLRNCLSKAYEEKLTGGRFPVSFLFINVPADFIDVNIHPAKLTVKFKDEEEVARLVMEGIKAAFEKQEVVPEFTKPGAISLPSEIKVSEERSQTSIKDFLAAFREDKDLEEVQAVKEDSVFSEKEYERQPSLKLENLWVTDVLFNTYILAKDEQNLYLIDQHAAHERIFYELLLKNREKDSYASQVLLAPFVSEIPRNLHHMTDEIEEEIESFGYALDEFSNNSFLVKSIPYGFSLQEGEDFLKEYLQEATTHSHYEDKRTKEVIAKMACKKAVKAGDRLSTEEALFLITQLGECDNPYNCPHGRPVIVKFSKYEIEKMFKRV